jgi:UrcA family protein
MRMVVGSVAAVVIASMSGQASGSQLATNVKQRVVHYSDLNLGNTADAVTLYNRISHAAHMVCGLPVQSNDETGARHRACVVDAIERSVSDVNAPELTRYYESRRPKAVLLAMETRKSVK